MDRVSCCTCNLLVEFGGGVNESEGRLFGETLDGLAWELLVSWYSG